MKAVVVFKNTLRTFVAAMVLLSAGAWAANKGSLDLLHPTTVAGTKLPTGNYTVQWLGSGDEVQIKIYQGKKEVASTSAHVVQLDRPAAYSGAVVNNDGNGGMTLSQIRFAGKKMALDVSGEGGSSGTAGGVK